MNKEKQQERADGGKLSVHAKINQGNALKWVVVICIISAAIALIIAAVF